MFSAVRRNYCFTVVSRGRCSDEISAKTTFQDCCCGVGKGWGDKELCQLCPDKETGKRFYHLSFHIHVHVLWTDITFTQFLGKVLIMAYVIGWVICGECHCRKVKNFQPGIEPRLLDLQTNTLHKAVEVY